jgi:hypothetical protein
VPDRCVGSRDSRDRVAKHVARRVRSGGIFRQEMLDLVL